MRSLLLLPGFVNKCQSPARVAGLLKIKLGGWVIIGGAGDEYHRGKVAALGLWANYA